MFDNQLVFKELWRLVVEFYERPINSIDLVFVITFFHNF